MRLHISIAALLVAGIGRVGAQAPLDDLTPCSVAVRAFASKNEAKTREIGEFMDSIFERLDQEHKKSGEPAILNDRLTRTLEAAAQGLCSQRQRSTISNEAAEAYRYIRELKVPTSVEP
jgi:hypothetical protein